MSLKMCRTAVIVLMWKFSEYFKLKSVAFYISVNLRSSGTECEEPSLAARIIENQLFARESLFLQIQTNVSGDS